MGITPVEGRFEVDENSDSQVLFHYKSLWNQIAEIDEALDAGSEAATKRKFTNELVEATRKEWETATTQMIEAMKQMPAETLAGVFYGVVRSLSAEFKEPAEKLITAQVEAAPKSEDNLSEDDKKALGKERSELAKTIKTVIDMAQVFGEFEEGDEWPAPKRRGAVGKRGKRALGLYDWSVDGVEVGEDDNSPKGMSILLGFEKQADFTAALKAAGIDTTSPADTFSVTLNGKEVSAVRGNDEEDAEGEEVPTEPESDED